MGLFGEIVDGFTEFVSSVCEFARDLAPKAAVFIREVLPVFAPVLEPRLAVIIEVLGAVICAVAQVLVDKPEEEKPEELGMKAERCREVEGLTEDDFNSAEEYVRYLRERYPVVPGEVESLDETERQKYALTGIALYSQEVGEKYGMDLGPRFWRAVREAGLQDPAMVDKLLTAMGTRGVQDGDQLDSFLRGALPAGSPEREAAYDAMKACLEEQGAEDPAEKIDDLMTAYGEKFD